MNHSKRGGVQKYPLQREVGEAILEYIRKARPRNLLPKSVPYAETSVPRHRIQQPLAHHEYKNRRGRHPMPAARTALSAARVCHSFAGTRSISEGIGDLLGHRDSNSTRIYAKVHLATVAPRSGLRSGRSAMKLAAAVDIYVLHRRAMGQKFEGPAAALRAFSRRYSNSLLKGITSADVKQFLDRSANRPRRLATEIWGIAGLLHVLAVPRKTERCSLATSSSQAYGRPSFRISTPVGSFVCCWTQFLVVSEMQRAGHPQSRFAPYCCSSTERACGWEKRLGCV